MIKVDYEKFSYDEIQACESSAIHRTIGSLEAIAKYSDNYTKEEIELAKFILSGIKESLALVLKS